MTRPRAKRKGGWSERANPNRSTPGRRGGDVFLARLGGLESGAKEAEEARGVGGEAEGIESGGGGGKQSSGYFAFDTR